MKQIILLTVLIILFLCHCLAQVKISKVKFTGEVIAYIDSNNELDNQPPVSKNIALIVKLNAGKKTESEYIKLITASSDAKSPLPQKIFSGLGKWEFTVTRSVECNSVLTTTYSDLIKMSGVADFNNEDSWIVDSRTKAKIFRPEEILKIPEDKVLHCYSILFLKEKQ